MAYPTYITEALVCGSIDNRSADRSFLLFTREAGMLYASARSVREERSKQRYALQVASYVRATLVRGKSGWRVAGVEPMANFYARSETREARAFIRSIMLLLRRIMQGEVSHPDIFDDVIAACKGPQSFQRQRLERVLSLRILHTLGYVAPGSAYDAFLHCALPYERIVGMTAEEEEMCRLCVERALIESHL